MLIVDSGKPRNYASRAIHGFLGQHGIAPGELLARGRAEAEAAGAEICHSVARRVERVGDIFEVTTSAEMMRTRRVALAYGVRDILPDIPEIASYYGGSVFHCPDCDGYEVRDKRVGVIGWGKKVVGLALELLQWTGELTVFTDGHARDFGSLILLGGVLDDRDFAGDVEVMALRAQATFDHRRTGSRERPRAVQYRPHAIQPTIDRRQVVEHESAHRQVQLRWAASRV